MEDTTTGVGDIITVTVRSTSGRYMTASGEGITCFTNGSGMIGDRHLLRVTGRFSDHSNNVFYGICRDDTIALRVDKVTSDDVKIGYLGSEPIVIESPVNKGDWYRCRVTSIETDRAIAEVIHKITSEKCPDVASGQPPDDHTQRKNHLINNRHTDL